VAPPKRLVIPSIGVDANVEYVGLTPDGAMDVPKNPAQVAWYKNGPKPGDRGNALIAGHVDWGGKVQVFYPLKQLKQGDAVTVVADDGHKYDYVVQWSKWYDAQSSPAPEVFRSTDTPELTLITCGGEFDHVTKQYLSRLVVRAEIR
jgi:LPXTG-site transpeptidase (sortase) family protein